MTSAAISSQGTQIYYADVGSPPSWTQITEINTIGGPDGTVPLIDVSNLDSSAKEYIGGLPDEGSLSVGMRYIPSNAVHSALLAGKGTTYQFQIRYPDSVIHEFTGLITGFNISSGVDAPIAATMTIKLSGSILETA